MPTTPEGKAVSAMNATKHGVLSTRLFLPDESPDEFAALQDDLRRALRPEGAYELLLVERMAVTIWRQRRLIRAESAGIELRRAGWNRDVARAVDASIGHYVSVDDLAAPSEDAQEEVEWSRLLLAEFEQIRGKAMTAAILSQYPTIYEQAKIDADGEAVEKYYADPQVLAEFLNELQEWSRKTLRKHNRYSTLVSLAEVARRTQDVPIKDEMLTRYTTALDNELVKIARELREAQAWRQKTVTEVAAAA